MKVTAGSLGFSRGLKPSVGAAEVGRCWVLSRAAGTRGGGSQTSPPRLENCFLSGTRSDLKVHGEMGIRADRATVSSVSE